jgi:hypothetical protein
MQEDCLRSTGIPVELRLAQVVAQARLARFQRAETALNGATDLFKVPPILNARLEQILLKVDQATTGLQPEGQPGIQLAQVFGQAVVEWAAV